jgi:hypothetical protein
MLKTVYAFGLRRAGPAPRMGCPSASGWLSVVMPPHATCYRS